MAALLAPPVQVLMISKRVARWIDGAGSAIKDAFGSALDFTETLLARVAERLDVSGVIIVMHQDTILMLRFVPALDRFCIVACYFGEDDSLPPDGPPGVMVRPTVAQHLVSAIGLSASGRDARSPDDAGLPASQVSYFDLVRRIANASGAGLPTNGLAVFPFSERDLPKPRSNCLWVTEPQPAALSISSRAVLAFARSTRLKARRGVESPDNPTLS